MKLETNPTSDSLGTVENPVVAISVVPVSGVTVTCACLFPEARN